MSMYYCEGCEKLVDNDFFPCSEEPGSKSGGLLCPDCLAVVEEANDVPWSTTIKGATLKRTPPSEER